MVFCPIARGNCPGRSRCILWARGRIVAEDDQSLASKLARHILQHTKDSRQGDPTDPEAQIPPEVLSSFWEQEGLPNISQLRLIDRELDAKVSKVEELAIRRLASKG